MATYGIVYPLEDRVISMISQALPRTIVLTVAALAVPIGLLAGIVSTLRQNSIFDRLSIIGSFFAASIPNYGNQAN